KCGAGPRRIAAEQRPPRLLSRSPRRGPDRTDRKGAGRVIGERARCMALKDKIALGVALPHRSPEPIDIETVRGVAQRAEALGFCDLWVTENTLDHVFCFDPVVVLTYAAAV